MDPSNDKPESERIADAVRRLERAVNDLAKAAGDRAADYVERATRQLREEAPATERSAYPQREPAWLWSDQPRTAKLQRDVKRGKIFGVCAGFASYYGLETWVVRLLAVTGLVFLTGVVFVGYLAATLILDKNVGQPEQAANERRSASSGRRRDDRQRSASPFRRLREVRAHFDEMELRLRRMEAHVTSGQYELQRELAKIGKP